MLYVLLFHQIIFAQAIQHSLSQPVASDEKISGPHSFPASRRPGAPHVLLESPSSLLSFVEARRISGVSERPAESARSKGGPDICDVHGDAPCGEIIGNIDSYRRVDTYKGHRQRKASLKHAEDIPTLDFLQRKDGHRPGGLHSTAESLEHAIRQLFYAYPVLESHNMTVHLHRRGQKKLISDLHSAGAFDLDVHKPVTKEWSFLQSMASSYGRDNSRTNTAEANDFAKSRTYSRAQEILDTMCQDFLQNDAVVARYSGGKFHCVQISDLDFVRIAECVDDCFFRFGCFGDATNQAPKFPVDEALKMKILRKTCKRSELQARADHFFCGEKSVVRFNKEKNWLCVPMSSKMRTFVSLSCLDECGMLVRCLTPDVPTTLNGDKADVIKFLKNNTNKDCECDESGREGSYSGCQSKTRLGKVCQKWSSQSPHRHEALKESDHNFCRAADGAKDIWCFTTDPKVRFDYCDYLGPRAQVVHPGEEFDLILEGRMPTPSYEVAFFHHPSGKWESPCGGKKASSDIFVRRTPNKMSYNMKVEVARGHISALIWEGVTVSEQANGDYAICLCDYSYFISSYLTCMNGSHYTVHAGWLHVKGPIIPDATFSMETGKPYTLSVTGVGFNLTDMITIMKAPYNCDSSAVRFAETMSGLFNPGQEGKDLIRKAIMTGSSMVARMPFSKIDPSHDSSEVVGSPPPFTLYHTGTYEVCWTSGDKQSSAPAGKITVSGIELHRQFYALYVPTSGSSKDRPFPIFIIEQGTDLFSDYTSLYLSKVSDALCSGSVVGKAKGLSPYSSSTERDRSVYVAESIVLSNLNDKAGVAASTLEVCLILDGPPIFLGYAHVGRSLVFPLDTLQVEQFGMVDIPRNVFTYTLPKLSTIAYYWSGSSDMDCFYEKDLPKFFSKGDFPKVLSFWVDSEAITVWQSTLPNPAPQAFARFEVSDAVAVAVSAIEEKVLFYLVRENPGRIEKYDMTQPNHLKYLQPSFTTSAKVPLISPCDITTLEGSNDTLVLAVDSGAKKVLLFDAKLDLVESKSTWEGLSRPLESPRSVRCIQTPLPGNKSNRELFDCYITDPGNHRLVLIQINTRARASSFISEVSSSEDTKQRLVNPHTVVAYPYNGFTLIYVAEKGQSQPMLLTKPDGQRQIRLYQRLKAATDGELEMQAMCLLTMGSHASSGLEAVWLLRFLRSYEGPTIRATPLDTTATAPDFKYTPRDWYALGEEHILEPSIASEGSSYGLTGFALNKQSKFFAFMERNVTIDERTGIITLKLVDIQEQEVAIEITGIGIVNSVKTAFTFRVACRDGHYYSQGMCVKCQAGTFNSLALVRESPSSYFHSCRSCDESRTTLAEGSASEEQCLCKKGYHIDELGDPKACIPCPPGSYKDTIANVGCTGVCPEFSFSNVSGAESSKDRKCSCLPGYYAVYDEAVLTCNQVEVGYFSLGGYDAKKIKCPPLTSTNPANGLAVDLTHCLCQPGYAPVDPESLKDPSSPASKLKEWILLNPAYGDLKDSQVCTLCGRRFYKGRVSAEPCTQCPLNSFSSSDGPTSKNSCNMCIAGYYLTSNIDLPCGECQADHFCVGSEPSVKSLEEFAGMKVACSKHTRTMKPYNQNSHPHSCMCEAGYEFTGIDVSTKKVICEAADFGVYKASLGNIKGIRCPPGSNTLSMASTSLADCVCSAGYYLDEQSRICQPCPIGAYCLGGINPATKWHRSYTPCPVNTTTKEERSTSADDCLCDKGFYWTSTGDNTTCSQCSINSFKDWTGNEACKQCSENSGTSGTGSTSSAQCLCRPGYYYNDELRECIACKSPFKYCPGGETDCDEGDEHCVGGKKPIQPINCPPHTRITEGFDTPSSIDDCKCQRGYAFKQFDPETKTKICEPCSEGSYKSTVQDINCNGLCGVSSTSLSGAQEQVQCFCEEGTYYTAGACHGCPDGAVCKGGLMESAIEALQKDPSYVDITNEDHIKPYAQAGYYLNKLKPTLESPSDWQFIKCPIANACLEFGVCSVTMENYLCSECRYGYTNNFNKDEMCTACPRMTPNALLLVGYQLALLLFNIGMAYMNVAAGFNRRSIHSIVIKIASNFLTCMSVLTVVDFDKIELPSWLTSITSRVSETITQKEGNTHMMAVECLFREGLDLSFADSFFFTMLFYSLLPILLPFVATFILYFLVNRFRHYYRNGIKKKLLLLVETEKHGLINLTEQLKDKYEEDRAFMIFRYIPIPGDSRWRRFTKFMEDMIPIYVTVVFFLYTATTRHMLSLLDCTVIDFGALHGSKYYLRAAMSVECKLDPTSEYFKFFTLGIVGIAVWSIGIPLGAFLVLYANRKVLNSRETRLKFGFLHNGFVKKYWFWETVVFARKLCVLIISSTYITGTSDSNGSRLWPAIVTAVLFNIYHLRSQPFDKRNYSTLDNLENHSMSVWTLTICIMLAVAGSNFSGNVNLALAIVILVAIVLFALEVAINLLYAYFDNVRANRQFFEVPVLGYMFRTFARWSEKRKSWEPIVVYDVDNDVIQLIAAKRQRRLKISTKQSITRINVKERQYFLKVMAETLGFAAVHMKLDVIPGTFLEFVLRLGFAFHKMDEDNQENKKSLQAIAGGDISMLADWSQRQNKALSRRKEELKDRGNNASIEGFLRNVEKKISRKQRNQLHSRVEEERLRDIEGGHSGSELDEDADEEPSSDSTSSRIDESDRPPVQHLISELPGDEQLEASYIFDNEVMGSGIPLSELYLSLLKLQLKDAMSISQQYEIFKAKKAAYVSEAAHALHTRNRKLKLIKYALQAASEGEADADIASLGFTQEALDQLRDQLDQMLSQQNRMRQTLQRLQNEPDTYEGEDLELEWIAEDEGQKQSQFATEAKSQRSTESDDVEDDDSDASHSQCRPIKVIGYDGENWIEDEDM